MRNTGIWILAFILFVNGGSAVEVVEEKSDELVRHQLISYFRAPELPERYYNPEVVKKKKGKKKSTAKADAKIKAPLPLFMNPVLGATKSAIISLYGDPRGKRRHQGVDIVAPKGTFVVAPSEGVVTKVGWNILGGKVVWMDDGKRNHTYYFAHLDSQIVKQGMYVKQGDTLGTVGNTGNAKYTRSHLHFGIYHKGGKKPLGTVKSRDQFISMRIPTIVVP